MISVHLLDTLLTVGGNLTRDHRYRSSNASSNAIGRYRISADREDPGPAEGTDDLGRLAAWVSLSLNPRVTGGSGMRVEVWVSSPEPGVGVFTTAGTCQGRLRRQLRDRLRRPLTEPVCRQVRQLSGSGEGPGQDRALSQGRGDLGDGDQDQRLTATVTATAAANR